LIQRTTQKGLLGIKRISYIEEKERPIDGDVDVVESGQEFICGKARSKNLGTGRPEHGGVHTCCPRG
jgi:hypothetical protein